ncbi:hypothetical protein ACET3X_004957 [Alternaria dauci]|uniref:Uncharacterized protein n=1 Tax=Alternaria dauci TaxID=48095 RepID=A0ABR3UIW6_9PLEO
MSQPPATAVPTYSFPSVKARRRFVETHTELIVEMMKSSNMELFDNKDPLVEMASAFIYGLRQDNASHYIQAPNTEDIETLSEAYFTLWAHTAWGREEIKPWRAFQKKVYDAFEAPRFLRELLTRGTRLHWEWTTGRGLRLTPDQKVAVALLQSKDQLVSAVTATNSVEDIFRAVQDHQLSWHDLDSVEEVLYLHDRVFDQDFQITKQYRDQAWFTLPSGQENKIFMPWYSLGQIGYHDIPDWPARSNTPSPLVTDLPAEIMSMILEKVFKINGEIHVIFDRSENEYIAVVEREQRLRKHPFGVPGQDLPYGNFWKLPSMRHFFAFGITSRENWLMMKAIFYRKNKFVIHDD